MGTASRSILASTLLLLAAGATTWAQRPLPQPVPPVLVESLAGRDSFDRYCAPCHGVSGRGDGPVAPALHTRPADLTMLTRQHDGAFPRDAVRDFVTGTGRTPQAHGTSEMPVWGPMFGAFESDARVRERIANLVSYVESLQAPTTLPEDLGGRLFRTHCASCHGTHALGDGPLATRLRRMPPDLTTFTARNGGVFPSERVHRIIDGRDVPSHGDRDMPVWGDVFQAAPGHEADARIEAIVKYLEGIQRRGA